MSLINIKNLSFAYGAIEVFDNASFQIHSEWRLGLVGRNGRGKTTLLKILCGELAYSGTISCPLKFDYFPFEADANMMGIDLANQVVGDYEDWQLFKELNLLSIDAECLYRPIGTLSGGERTKLLFALLFLKQNNFLLIDEPTNHLDLEGREVVSQYLKKKKGFILVSHDKSFLDVCTNHILSINKASIEVQQGNFSAYLAAKEQRDLAEQNQNKKLMGEIERLKGAANRSSEWAKKGYRQSTDGSAPDSGQIGFKEFHRKKVGKLESQVKVLQRRQQKSIEQKSKLLKDVETIQDVRITNDDFHSSRLVSAKELGISFGQALVVNGLSFEIMQGERVALCGKNGSGKSSVLNAICGQTMNLSGELWVAQGLKVSRVRQDISHMSGSIRAYAKQCGVELSLFFALLNKLDFCSEQFDYLLQSLSHGQRKKVQIAISLCQAPHLFVWDEPLNYIDIFCRMQIEKMLIEYNPTMIFVEHDKDFIEKIATKRVYL